MSLTLEQAKAQIDSIMAGYASSKSHTSLVSDTLTAGKVYEAWVLSIILERLRVNEGYDVVLVGSTKVHLKSSPGPINSTYPHFRLTQAGRRALAVWTDVEFAALSYSMQGITSAPTSPYLHELDIVVVPYGTAGHPRHNQIHFGVECKNSTFAKSMMRAALGVRRELSLLREPQPTIFSTWPRSAVPADPPSVLAVFSTDSNVAKYQPAGGTYGVDFCHAPM